MLTRRQATLSRRSERATPAPAPAPGCQLLQLRGRSITRPFEQERERQNEVPLDPTIGVKRLRQAKVDDGNVVRGAVTIDSLPDLALLRIFSNLPPVYVVECVAQVSTRWKALSKAKCLWSGAAVTETSEARGKKFVRVLQGAFKVRSLTVEYVTTRLKLPEETVVTASFDTTGGTLTIYSKSVYVFLLALKHLTQDIQELSVRETAAVLCSLTTFESVKVWKYLDGMQALQRLTLTLPLAGGLFNSIYRSPSVGSSAVSALTKLAVYIKESGRVASDRNPQSEALLSFVATKPLLQFIVLGSKRPQVDVLLHCPNLKRVWVPAVKGIKSLLKCRKLHHLVIPSVHQDAVSELALVLYAPRIQQTLSYLSITTAETLQDTDLCMAITGLHNLSRLDIIRPVREGMCYLPRIFEFLPKLRCLTLIGMPAASTLDEIAGDSISRFRYMNILNSSCRGDGCGFPALVRLIRRLPDLGLGLALHVVLPGDVAGACIQRHGAMRLRLRPQENLLLSSHPDTSTSTCRACTRCRSKWKTPFLYVCIDDFKSISG